MVDKIVIKQSVCTRCGKTRIVTESHQETIGNSVVTFRKTSCPDSECQKVLDSELLVEKERRLQNFSQKSSSRFRKK